MDRTTTDAPAGITAAEADLLLARAMATIRGTPQVARVRARFGPTARASAAALAVAVIAVVGLVASAPSHTAGPSLAPAVSAGPAAVTATPSPGPGLATFHAAGIAFDYPASWTRSSSSWPHGWLVGGTGSGTGSFVAIDGDYFVGTAQASAGCEPTPVPGPSASDGTFDISVECDPFSVRGFVDGGVEVRVSIIDHPHDYSFEYVSPATARSVTVGGRPAAAGSATTMTVAARDFNRALAWVVPPLEAAISGGTVTDRQREYVITAVMNGADLAPLQAQVDALVASIRFDSPAGPAETAPTPEASPTGLTRALRTIDVTGTSCNGIMLIDSGATLHGDPADSRVAWLDVAGGGTRDLVFPTGFVARFSPGLEILDALGRVAFREGETIPSACVYSAGLLIGWP